MKNRIKIIVLSAAALLVVGLGANRAEAGGTHFSIGVNLGVPVVGAYLPPPVPVVAPVPVGYYGPERVGYYNHYGYRHWRGDRDCRYDRFRDDRGWHRGWDRDNRGRDRDRRAW
jgi:hypothetical protein